MSTNNNEWGKDELLLLGRLKDPDRRDKEYSYNDIKDIFSTEGMPRSKKAIQRKWEKITDRKKASFIGPDIDTFDGIDKQKPKILIFDIETAPINAWVWRIWKENVGTERIESDWFCLSWSAKWLLEPVVISDKLNPAEVREHDDERIMKSIWHLINEADVVVTHNGDRFDIVRLNTRFLMHGFPQPLPYQSIDTLKVAKRKFGFTSNKLDYISKVLKLEGKIKTGGMSLWLDILPGCYKDEERCLNALEHMETYNRRDVTLLEEVYLKLRAWVPSHPNFGLFVDNTDSLCHVCGSDQLDWDGYYNTLVGRYKTYRCTKCGAIGRSRKSILPKDKRKELVAPIAR